MLKTPAGLTNNNGWLAGFLDSDGSIYLNLQSKQMFITAAQKTLPLLEPLVDLYGGKIYELKKVKAYKWTMYRKQETLNMLDYFSINPLRSAKKNRVMMIKL